MRIPDDSNGYQSDHVELLLSSFLKLVGRDLIQTPSDPTLTGRTLFEAPIFVASHDRAADPVLTYGNQTALDLFEMSWEAFTSTPSRYTAEAPERSERERLLAAVNQNGYIDDYSGIRISSSGKRFLIKSAIVWNVIDPSGETVGQAATFADWQAL